MSPEIVVVVSVGVALACLILTSQRTILADLTAQRQDLSALREESAALHEDFAALCKRMAHLGLLDDLWEAITRKRVSSCYRGLPGSAAQDI